MSYPGLPFVPDVVAPPERLFRPHLDKGGVLRRRCRPAHNHPGVQNREGHTTATPVIAATSASVYQQLRGHLAELKLADTADALRRVLDQAQAGGWTFTHALENLLSIEIIAPENRSLSGRFHFADRPTGATLNDFDAASGIDRSLLAELGTCRYPETATNVLMIGPTGVGKTHVAIGLGHAAVRARATAALPPPPPTSPPVATAPRSRANASQQCTSSPARHCSSSTNSATCRGPPRPRPSVPTHQPALTENVNRDHHEPAGWRLNPRPPTSPPRRSTGSSTDSSSVPLLRECRADPIGAC